MKRTAIIQKDGLTINRKVKTVRTALSLGLVVVVNKKQNKGFFFFFFFSIK